jgi:hypothetical protein
MTAPLTPPECDLQDFPFMPLHVARLRDSDLASECSPEACWYAVLLWAASWHQLPAASLPDNEIVLAKLCGLGRDLRTFRKHRADAMRGFVKCDDGRLYHPVVAEQALEGWHRKLQQRWRTECARIKKANQRNGTDLPMPTFDEWLVATSPPSPEIVPRDSAESPPGHRIQETGTGTGILKEEAIASLAGSAEPMPPGDGLFGEGLPETPAPKPDPWLTNADFQRLWKACTHQMRTRSSQAKAWAPWRQAADLVGADRLADALNAYRLTDPDVQRSGGPGVHLWLKDRKWEHWLGQGASVEALPTPDPNEVWRGRVRRFTTGSRYWDDLDWGPRPGRDGCRVPTEIIVEFTAPAGEGRALA